MKKELHRTLLKVKKWISTLLFLSNNNHKDSNILILVQTENVHILSSYVEIRKYISSIRLDTSLLPFTQHYKRFTKDWNLHIICLEGIRVSPRVWSVHPSRRWWPLRFHVDAIEHWCKLCRELWSCGRAWWSSSPRCSAFHLRPQTPHNWEKENSSVRGKGRNSGLFNLFFLLSFFFFVSVRSCCAAMNKDRKLEHLVTHVGGDGWDMENIYLKINWTATVLVIVADLFSPRVLVNCGSYKNFLLGPLL